jgi:protein gp37
MTIPTDPKRIEKGMWWMRALTLTRGCQHLSSGCRNCWSEAQSAMRSRQRNAPECYRGVTKNGRWNGVVEPMPAALEVPLHVRRPTTFAVWNDLAYERIPFEFVGAAFAVMAQCPQHCFVVLTKRPARLREFVNAWCHDDRWRWTFTRDATVHVPLPNVILGYSASTQAELNAGLPDLLATPAACRALSLEPLLEPIDLSAYLGTAFDGGGTNATYQYNAGLSWVIAGAESGPNRRPCRDEWLRDIAAQCEATGVPVFVKQGHDANGRVVPLPLGLRYAQLPEVSTP